MGKSIKQKKRLEEILDFVQLTNNFAYVYRDKTKNDGGRESDSEHSYQLAIVCWYLNNKFALGLNDERILKYSLVHDLTEIYEGDVPSVLKGRDQKVAKKVKLSEDKAIERLGKEFKDLDFLIKYIKDYENAIDEEARFVFATDKLIPMIFVYQTDADNYFHKHKITFEENKRIQISRTKVFPFIYELFIELAEFCEKKGIFYKEKS
ncbi:HD domain-containing protein [Candidatus Dojkabacteria bacterium]|nr:HD domain-containing protein [Candidatus Dojkabacteria bacterium]